MATLGWEVVMVVFSTTMAIHLGLVEAICTTIFGRKDLPVISCPRCLTFWSILVLLLFSHIPPLKTIATSFLGSYLSIWFDLFLGYLDKWYEKIYETITRERQGGSTQD